MNKPLFLFVGRSASGKTTMANILERHFEYKTVQSYTTRKPRYDGETGHIFVNKEEFNNLGELAAYTLYNGNEYGTTFEQLRECDIYVIDVPGVETLLNNYEKIDRPIYIIYFEASVSTCIDRMIDRNSSDMEIVSRLRNDHKFDWKDSLDKLVWHNSKNLNKNIELYTANANLSKNEVLDQVLYYMQRYMEV